MRCGSYFDRDGCWRHRSVLGNVGPLHRRRGSCSSHVLKHKDTHTHTNARMSGSLCTQKKITSQIHTDTTCSTKPPFPVISHFHKHLLRSSVNRARDGGGCAGGVLCPRCPLEGAKRIRVHARQRQSRAEERRVSASRGRRHLSLFHPKKKLHRHSDVAGHS